MGLPKGAIISLSNSSDPYQPLEEKFSFTRIFLERLVSKSFKLLIITKSDLLLRDLDILSKLDVVISLTITSIKRASLMEPGAPSFERRLFALKELKKRGFKCVVRLDPVIPGINDEEIMEVLDEVLPYGDHFVLSTYKAKPDSLKRLCSAFPEKSQTLKKLYLDEGSLLRGSKYLSYERRRKLLYPLIERISAQCKTYALCRENLPEINQRKGLCDGSYLLQNHF